MGLLVTDWQGFYFGSYYTPPDVPPPATWSGGASFLGTASIVDQAGSESYDPFKLTATIGPATLALIPDDAVITGLSYYVAHDMAITGAGQCSMSGFVPDGYYPPTGGDLLVDAHTGTHSFANFLDTPEGPWTLTKAELAAFTFGVSWSVGPGTVPWEFHDTISAFEIELTTAADAATTPLVDAGPAQVATGPAPSVVTTAATLTPGTNNGTITTAWTYTSGPDGAATPTIADPAALVTDITFASFAAGSYVFTLTATTAAGGFTATDTLTVTMATGAPRVSSGGTQLVWA